MITSKMDWWEILRQKKGRELTRPVVNTRVFDKTKDLSMYIDKIRSLNLAIDKERLQTCYMDKQPDKTLYLDKQKDFTLVRER